MVAGRSIDHGERVIEHMTEWAFTQLFGSGCLPMAASAIYDGPPEDFAASLDRLAAA